MPSTPPAHIPRVASSPSPTSPASAAESTLRLPPNPEGIQAVTPGITNVSLQFILNPSDQSGGALPPFQPTAVSAGVADMPPSVQQLVELLQQQGPRAQSAKRAASTSPPGSRPAQKRRETGFAHIHRRQDAMKCLEAAFANGWKDDTLFRLPESEAGLRQPWDRIKDVNGGDGAPMLRYELTPARLETFMEALLEASPILFYQGNCLQADDRGHYVSISKEEQGYVLHDSLLPEAQPLPDPRPLLREAARSGHLQIAVPGGTAKPENLVRCMNALTKHAAMDYVADILTDMYGANAMNVLIAAIEECGQTGNPSMDQVLDMFFMNKAGGQAVQRTEVTAADNLKDPVPFFLEKIDGISAAGSTPVTKIVLYGGTYPKLIPAFKDEDGDWMGRIVDNDGRAQTMELERILYAQQYHFVDGMKGASNAARKQEIDADRHRLTVVPLSGAWPENWPPASAEFTDAMAIALWERTAQAQFAAIYEAWQPDEETEKTPEAFLQLVNEFCEDQELAGRAPLAPGEQRMRRSQIRLEGVSAPITVDRQQLDNGDVLLSKVTDAAPAQASQPSGMETARKQLWAALFEHTVMTDKELSRLNIENLQANPNAVPDAVNRAVAAWLPFRNEIAKNHPDANGIKTGMLLVTRSGKAISTADVAKARKSYEDGKARGGLGDGRTSAGIAARPRKGAALSKEVVANRKDLWGTMFDHSGMNDAMLSAFEFDDLDTMKGLPQAVRDAVAAWRPYWDEIKVKYPDASGIKAGRVMVSETGDILFPSKIARARKSHENGKADKDSLPKDAQNRRSALMAALFPHMDDDNMSMLTFGRLKALVAGSGLTPAVVDAIGVAVAAWRPDWEKIVGRPPRDDDRVFLTSTGKNIPAVDMGKLRNTYASGQAAANVTLPTGWKRHRKTAIVVLSRHCALSDKELAVLTLEELDTILKALDARPDLTAEARKEVRKAAAAWLKDREEMARQMPDAPGIKANRVFVTGNGNFTGIHDVEKTRQRYEKVQQALAALPAGWTTHRETLVLALSAYSGESDDQLAELGLRKLNVRLNALDARPDLSDAVRNQVREAAAAWRKAREAMPRIKNKYISLVFLTELGEGMTGDEIREIREDYADRLAEQQEEAPSGTDAGLAPAIQQ